MDMTPIRKLWCHNCGKEIDAPGVYLAPGYHIHGWLQCEDCMGRDYLFLDEREKFWLARGKLEDAERYLASLNEDSYNMSVMDAQVKLTNLIHKLSEDYYHEHKKK